MAVTITTTSCETQNDYFLNKATAIYPAFVDNLPYESWTNWVSGATIDQTAKPYFQFRATGGSTYEWKVEPDTNSTLPPGLSISQDGQLSGTPTAEGLYEFTLRVTSGADYDTKRFKFRVYPERSRWLRDARFGVTTHWGRFTHPAIKNSPPRQPPLDGTGTSLFEDRVGQFDAANWALQMDNWGAGFIEFSAIWQDSYRYWDSKTYTRYQLHTERAFVDEIVSAFHARNLKVISYFPPDYRANPACEGGPPGCTDPQKFAWVDADDNGNWGSPNLGFITELVVDKKLDGLWIDIGGASDIYVDPPINPGWMFYTRVIPVIRYHNPFFIFGVNPGVRGSWNIELKFGGTQVLYPYADFVIYESTMESSTNALMGSELATPLMSKKKMAIYVSNKVTTTWGWGANTCQEPIKDSATVKENIALNWKAGATVAMGLPVRCDGLLVDPRFQPIMSEIGSYVTANKMFSEDPVIALNNNTVAITTNLPARILYTLDGTDPDEGSSNVYLNPIPITRNTIIKARTLQTGKSIGFVKQLAIETFAASAPSHLLLGDTPPSDSLSYQEVTALYKTVDNSRFYRGMQFTVGPTPIIVTGIGRRFVGSSVARSVIIKRYFDEYPIYSGTLLPNGPETAGYQFTEIAETRLEAGMTYIVAIQELSNLAGAPDATREKYYSNSFANIPYTLDLRIVKAFNLSPVGDFYPFPLNTDKLMDTVGQIINLKYRPVYEERKHDIALGKPVRFLNGLGGSTLIPAQFIRYAINATDGNPNSYAIAGGNYAYTIQVNLLSLFKVNRIDFRFTKYNYSTEFEIYCSKAENGGDAILLNRFVNNKNLDFQFKFDPVLTQYVFFKSILPNASGQEGGSMGFESIEVYSDGL